jgi:hypothetical protein
VIEDIEAAVEVANEYPSSRLSKPLDSCDGRPESRARVRANRCSWRRATPRIESSQQREYLPSSLPRHAPAFPRLGTRTPAPMASRRNPFMDPYSRSGRRVRYLPSEESPW